MIKNYGESDEEDIKESYADIEPNAKPAPHAQTLLLNTKCARIVVRNIPFDATAEQIKSHFFPYGGVIEVNLLLNKEGTSRGCAFIEFKKRTYAEKAIQSTNKKPFLKRKIFVDWAIDKDSYERKVKSGVIKKEKFGKKGSSELDDEVKEEEIKEESDESDFKEEDDEDNDYDDENEDDNGESAAKKSRSSDVDEGLTVFVQRIPFEVTEKEFKAKMLQFGPLYYAVISREPISGHSRGNGFVKYKTKDSVDLCLQSNGKMQMGSDFLDFTIAISRKDIRRNHEEKKVLSDSRNLYLLKEGLIVAGTKAAEGVSASDMAIRLRLEQVKSQMLKNLNRFISRDRLTMHNLPDACDDKKLRNIVEKVTQTKPKECRVMREAIPSAGHPQGKTKNFGFLSFKNHEDALQVLRKLNNNPVVFHKNRRPIVSFSLEDKKVHNIKQKRLEKSKLKNPTYQVKLEKIKQKRAEKKLRRKKLSENMPFTAAPSIAAANASKKAKKKKQKDKIYPEGPEFLGMEAKSGAPINLRSKTKLTKQSKLHAQTILRDKRVTQKERDRKDIEAEKREKDHQRPKMKVDKDSNDFANIVNKYKEMLTTSAEVSTENGVKQTRKRKKWFSG